MTDREWKRHRFALLMTRIVGATSAMAIYGVFMPPTLQTFVAAIASVAIGITAYSMIGTIYDAQQKHQEIRTNIQEKAPKIAQRSLYDPEFDPTPLLEEMLEAYIAVNNGNLLKHKVIGKHMKDVFWEDI